MNDEFIHGSTFVKFNPSKRMNFKLMEKQVEKYKHPKRHVGLAHGSCGTFYGKGSKSTKAKTYALRMLRESKGL